MGLQERRRAEEGEAAGLHRSFITPPALEKGGPREGRGLRNSPSVLVLTGRGSERQDAHLTRRLWL